MIAEHRGWRRVLNIMSNEPSKGSALLFVFEWLCCWEPVEKQEVQVEHKSINPWARHGFPLTRMVGVLVASHFKTALNIQSIFTNSTSVSTIFQTNCFPLSIHIWKVGFATWVKRERRENYLSTTFLLNVMQFPPHVRFRGLRFFLTFCLSMAIEIVSTLPTGILCCFNISRFNVSQSEIWNCIVVFVIVGV